jgi:hypothetical protein
MQLECRIGVLNPFKGFFSEVSRLTLVDFFPLTSIFKGVPFISSLSRPLIILGSDGLMFSRFLPL